MKIAMITFPYWGHIGYLLRLGNELKLDNEVIIYCGEKYKHEVEKERISFREYPIECEKLFLKANVTEHIEKGLGALYVYNDYIFGIADKMVKNYSYFISERMDLIIYDSNCFWGKIIADKIGIPSICVVSVAAINERMIDSFPSAFMKYFNLESDKEVDEKNLNRAIRLISRKLKVKYPELANFSVISTDKGTADININLFSKELQYGLECIKDEDYLFTGPFISKEQMEGTSKYIKKEKINVTLSFGTIYENIDNIVQIVNQINDDEINLIVIASKYYDKLKMYESENVQIINFTNLIQILKDTDIFIFHGGTNSYREAAYLAVPMIVVPQSSDQILNAIAINSVGIGRYVEKEELKYVDIQEMIFDMVHDKDMQKKSKDIADSMHKLGGLSAVKEVIEQVSNNSVENNGE